MQAKQMTLAMHSFKLNTKVCCRALVDAGKML